MKLLIKPINATAVRQFLKWKYEPPYHIYNLSTGQPSDIDEALNYFLNPNYEFYLLYSEIDQLVGFFSFGLDAQVPGGDYSAEAVDIGLAVHPDYTGRGLGIHFAKTAVSHAIKIHQPSLLRVTIAEFNQRAQKVWQRLGFEIVDHFEARRGKRPFVILTRKGTS